MRILSVLLMMVPFVCFADDINPAILAQVDSLYRNGPSKQQTHVFQIHDKAVSYFATTVMTIPSPLDSVLAIITRYGDYFKTHSYVSRSERVDGNTYFIVLGVLWMRAWFLGEITAQQNEDGIQLVSFKQTDRDSWREWCRSSLNARGRVDLSVFRMYYRLSTVEGGTRVSLNAYVKPERPVPRWLFRYVIKQVFPRFLKEVNRESTKAK